MQTRNRAVIFRLTDEEYGLLRNACLRAGGRNMSDFARTGLMSQLETDPKNYHFTVIEERLDSLSRELHELRKRLELET